MSTHCQRITQFYLPSSRLFTSGMNRTYLCLTSQCWFSFSVRFKQTKDIVVIFAFSCTTHNAETELWAHSTDTSWWSSLVAVPERIVFKLCTIIFKCLHQTALQYLQELCIPVTASTSRPHLRSAARERLPVIRPASDDAGLLPALQNCAIICHRHFVIQHWHLHFFAADKDTSLRFGLWTCTLDCLGYKSGAL